MTETLKAMEEWGLGGTMMRINFRFLTILAVGTLTFNGHADAGASRREVVPVSVSNSSAVTRDSAQPQRIQLQVRVYEDKTVWAKTSQNVTYFYCDYSPSASPFFDKYLNAPRNSQARLLSDAVSGLGYERASTIVNDRKGYLSSRPTSWNVFSAEIWRIESDFADRDESFRGLWHDVIISNGEANFRSLGFAYPGFGSFSSAPSRGNGNYNDDVNYSDGSYNDDEAPAAPRKSSPKPVKSSPTYNDDETPAPAPGAKRSGGYNDDEPNNGPAPVPAPAPAPAPSLPSYNCYYRTVARSWYVKTTSSELKDVESKEVEVSFRDSILLNGETEEVVFVWGGHGQPVSVNTQRAINTYQQSTDDSQTKWVLTSTGRKAISPSSRDFQKSLEFNGGKFTLTVSDNRAEELSKLSNGAYKISVTVSAQVPGGMCSSAKPLIQNKSFELANGSGSHDLAQYFSAPAVAGDTVEITSLSVARVGTTYFSGAADIGAVAVKYPK